MYTISPVIVVVLSALIGMGIMMYLNRRAYSAALGGLLGAGAGAAAAFITMTPLQFCTFETERDPINIALGWIIILAVMAAIVSALRWLVPRLLRLKSLFISSDTVHGAYSGTVKINSLSVLGFVLLAISAGIAGWLTMQPIDADTGITSTAMLWLSIGGVLLFALNWYLVDFKTSPITRTSPLFKPWLPIPLAATFLSPTLFILLVFIYYPMLDTFSLSTQLARLGAPRTRFICLDNFVRLFGDPDYLYSLSVSFFIAIMVIVLAISLSLFIATMAYLPIKGARIYRTLLIWPYALSPVIAGSIFRLLFNPQAGVINYVLNSTFGFTVPWLLDPNIAPWTIILTSVWNIMGFNILFYIAGLQNVPKDLIEAAAIDGANAVQRFFRITFPLLSPITFFLVVTNTTYAFFDTFGVIDFLTAGGPLNSTSTLMYEVFVVGVQSRDLGKAAAQSLVLFLIVIGITVIQFRASRRTVTYGA